VLKFIAAWLVAAVVVGAFVTVATALTETPEEKKEKQEKREQAAKARALQEISPPDEVVRRLQVVRGLEFRGEPPKVQVVEDKELATKAVEADAAASESSGAGAKSQATSQAADLLLTQAGVVRPEDLEKAEQGSGAGAMGRFVSAEGTVLLSKQVLERDPRLAEAVLAHELARALDEQQFGPAPRRAEPLRDEEAAVAAVREGSATRAERGYAAAHLGGQAVDEVGDLRRRADTDDPQPLLAYAHFPSTAGERYVAGLYEEGQWEAVDERLREPPSSTSAILRPGEGDDQGAVAPAALETDAQLPQQLKPLASSTMGELDVVALLRAAMGEEEALALAAERRAGQVTTFAGQGQCPPPCREKSVSVAVLRWSGEEPARRFAQAFRGAFEQGTGAQAEGGRGWTVEKAGAALVREGPTTALVFAPDVQLAGQLAEDAATGDGDET
jgi:hypothetical protein